MEGSNRNHSVAVLVSGGLDSLVLLDQCARTHAAVFPLYVRGGLAWERPELYWLRRFLAARPGPPARPLAVLDLPAGDLYGDHWSVTGAGVPGYFAHDSECYLPGRNILLLAKAGVYCARHEIPVVAMAQLKGNPFPDSTPRFRRSLAGAFSLGLDFRLRIITPFLRFTKPQVIRRGRHLPLHLTFSCMRPADRRHCGVCTKCAERRNAFAASDVPDRTRYAAGPPTRRPAASRGAYAY